MHDEDRDVIQEFPWGGSCVGDNVISKDIHGGVGIVLLGEELVRVSESGFGERDSPCIMVEDDMEFDSLAFCFFQKPCGVGGNAGIEPCPLCTENVHVLSFVQCLAHVVLHSLDSFVDVRELWGTFTMECTVEAGEGVSQSHFLFPNELHEFARIHGLKDDFPLSVDLCDQPFFEEPLNRIVGVSAVDFGSQGDRRDSGATVREECRVDLCFVGA